MTDTPDEPDFRQVDDAMAGEEKPRLTEEEKKQNHIASEHKRRNAIREAYERLSQLVPGLAGKSRSEGVVLQKTVEYIGEALEERRRLIQELEALGVPVSDADKLPLSQPQGRDIDVKSGRNEEDREEGEANGSQSDGSSVQ